jgi:raffinose/stachyose/melibiose transport system substrate-binding protein
MKTEGGFVMKKALLLSVAMLFVLSTAMVFASGEAEKGGAESGEAEKIELSMLDYLDQTDQASVNEREALMEAFQESHPNISLDVEYLFDEAYHNQLQAMMAADQLPDLMFLWPGARTGQVTSSGKIKDISDRVEPHKDKFISMAVAPQGPNGEIYELPEQVTATHVMFTNTRLMDELGLEFPDTMQELIEQGQTIRDAGYTPVAMDNGGGWQMQSTFLSALVARTGGREYLEAAETGEASFADNPFVDALEVINTLSRNEMFTPGLNQASYGQALTDFVNENAVYLIDGGWRVVNLSSELSAEQKEYVELNVFPEVPNNDGITDSTAMVAGTGFGMHSRLEGAKADAAWEWIWFFAGPEGSKIRQSFGRIPAYKMQVPEDADPMVKKLSSFINNTPSGYVLDARLSQEAMGTLQPSIQEMILGNKSPQNVAQEFEQWIQENEDSRQ